VSVIAVIFDFDDTLVPDSTTQLLRKYGVDTDQIWTVEAVRLVNDGYDPPLAYLRLLLDRVGPTKPLGSLNNAALRAFGATLDPTYFDGLPQMFDDLREIVRQSEIPDLTIEFYVVSSGLEEVIAGSAIIQRYFTGYYGCQLDEDPEFGILKYVKRCITFTEKTRYLFEINKGIVARDSRTKPHLVNQRVEERDRRVPFDHMIYIGDGLTDIPCFSLVAQQKGMTFGVFQPGAESAKQAFQRFLKTDRVHALYSPRYAADADLGSMIRAAVSSKIAEIAVRRKGPMAY